MLLMKKSILTDKESNKIQDLIEILLDMDPNLM